MRVSAIICLAYLCAGMGCPARLSATGTALPPVAVSFEGPRLLYVNSPPVKFHLSCASISQLYSTESLHPSASGMISLLRNLHIGTVNGRPADVKTSYADLPKGVRVEVVEDDAGTGGQMFRRMRMRIRNHPASQMDVDVCCTVFAGLPHVFFNVEMAAHDDVTLDWVDVWTFGGPGANYIELPGAGGVERYDLTDAAALGSARPRSGPYGFRPHAPWMRIFHEQGEDLQILFSDYQSLRMDGGKNRVRVIARKKLSLQRGIKQCYGFVLAPGLFRMDTAWIQGVADVYYDHGECRKLSKPVKSDVGMEFVFHAKYPGIYPVRLPPEARATCPIFDGRGNQLPFRVDGGADRVVTVVEMLGEPCKIISTDSKQ